MAKGGFNRLVLSEGNAATIDDGGMTTQVALPRAKHLNAASSILTSEADEQEVGYRPRVTGFGGSGDYVFKDLDAATKTQVSTWEDNDAEIYAHFERPDGSIDTCYPVVVSTMSSGDTPKGEFSGRTVVRLSFYETEDPWTHTAAV